MVHTHLNLSLVSSQSNLHMIHHGITVSYCFVSATGQNWKPLIVPCISSPVGCHEYLYLICNADEDTTYTIGSKVVHDAFTITLTNTITIKNTFMALLPWPWPSAPPWHSRYDHHFHPDHDHDHHCHFHHDHHGHHHNHHHAIMVTITMTINITMTITASCHHHRNTS